LLYADAGVWVAQQAFDTHPAQIGWVSFFDTVLTRIGKPRRDPERNSGDCRTI
jgi:hypothetical protein